MSEIKVNNLRPAGIANQAPQLNSFDCLSNILTEGDFLTCSAIATDPNADAIIYRLAPSNTCPGVIINSVTGAIGMNAHNGFVPSCLLAVEAFDGQLASTSLSVNLSVTNTVPTLSISDVTHPEDTIIIRNDAEVESSEGDWGVYSLDNVTVTGTKCSDQGALSINATTGAIELVAPHWFGSCNVKVIYDDQNGGVASDEFTLTYTAVNDGPIISGTCPTTGTQDAAYSCTALTAVDPEGDGYTWELAPTNTCAFLAINSINGDITGTPNDNQVGPCLLAVRGFDSTNYSSVAHTTNLSITNLQPTLTITNKTTSDTIGPVVIATDAQVAANEEGFGTYSIDDANTTGTKCSSHGVVTIHSTTGEITFDGVDGWVGTCQIRAVFNDGNSTNNTVFSQFQLEVLDTVGPTVTNVTSLATNTTYYLGDTISIQVVFNEPVVVNTVGGTPRILLDTGFVDRYANYVSGTGTNTLVFNYTVQNDDYSIDLDVETSATNISLNGGTLQDTFLNNATLTLPVGVAVNSLASNKNIVINGSYPFALITNPPTLVSPTSVTNLIIAGNTVVTYKYKWGIKASTDCSNPAGYSAEIAIATPIVENITALIIGDEVRFCVVGKNALGVWQPNFAATTAEWIKGEYAMGPIAFNGVTNLPNWRDVIIDNLGRIIARNARGEIFRSLDNGVTWNLQCEVISDINSKFIKDPGPLANMYLTANGNLYKVDPLNGAPCVELTSTLSDFTHTAIAAPVTIDSNGSLYLFISNAIGQSDTLYKSTDLGQSWSTHATLINHGWASSFAVDPSDPNKMVRFVPDDVDGTRDGIYTSANNGVTWTKVSDTERIMVDIQYKVNLSNTFYTGLGDLSTDAGATFSSVTNSYVVTDNRRFALNSNGEGFFLQESGASTLLKKSTDYGIATHATLYTFTNIASNAASQAISARQNVIATVVGNRLYISTDAGASFTQINWQGTKLALMTGISVENGQTVYGVTADWNIMKSIDAGESWQLMLSYGSGCQDKEPKIKTHQLDSDRLAVWSGIQTGSNCKEFISSRDGGANFTSGTFLNTTTEHYYLHNPKNPYHIALGYSSNYRQSFNAGEAWFDQYSSSGDTNSHSDGFFNPDIEGEYWQSNLASGQITKRSIYNSNTTSYPPGHMTAGMDAFVNSTGIFEIRSIARTGDVRVSTNNGASFSAMGVDPGLTSCNYRFFSTLTQNRNIMASICWDQDDLSFTRDGGLTWRTVDLDGIYGINCDARAIALHPNKIFVACKSYDVIFIKYQAIELINDVQDSILSIAEKALSNELIFNSLATEFANSEYAIIAAGAVCDASVTFNSAIPRTNDAAFNTTGHYQVCVKLTDSLANISYEKSPTIYYDADVPAGASFALINDLADGILKRHEYLDNNNELVGSITGVNYDNLAFAIIPSAATCDASASFSYSKPLSHLKNQFVQIDEGAWKACLRLSDSAGNGFSYAQSTPFTYSDAATYAQLTNTPTYISNKLSTNINVTGLNVTKYRFKLGTSVVCNDSSGYSGEIPIATPINESLVSLFNSGIHTHVGIRVCVVASDNSDNWQPFAEATSHYWALYRHSATKIAGVPNNFIDNWRDALIDIHDHSKIYGIDLSGMTYLTNNYGITWSKLCQIPQYLTSFQGAANRFIQSPGNDESLYYFINSEIYRIENSDGGYCKLLTKDVPQILSSNSHIPTLTINTDGTLYTLAYDGLEQKEVIYMSKTRGISWQRTGYPVTPTNTTYTAQIVADPHDPTHLVASFIHGSRPDLWGAYSSYDNGKTWTKRASFPSSNIFVLPSNATANTWYTTDSSRCTSNLWTTTTSCYKFSDISWNRYFQSQIGESYRGSVSSNSDYTTFMVASKYAVPLGSSSTTNQFIAENGVFATYSFGIEANTNFYIASGRLYISNNGGFNFTKATVPNPTFQNLTIQQAGNHGKSIIATTDVTMSPIKAFTTTDGGVSWNEYFEEKETCPTGLHQFSTDGDLEYGQYVSMNYTNCSGNPKFFRSYGKHNTTYNTQLFSNALGKDLALPSRGARVSSTQMAMTDNYWQSFDLKNYHKTWLWPTSIWNQYPYVFIDPTNSTRFFELHRLQDGQPAYENKLFRTDFMSSVATDLLANINHVNSSAIAISKDGAGGHYLYSMNHQGKLERSADYGATFAVINTNTPYSGTVCYNQLTLSADPETGKYLMAFCTQRSLSWNGGVSFSTIINNIPTDNTISNCQWLNNYFDGRQVMISCHGGMFKLEFNDFDLANNVADYHLDSSEQAAGLALLTVKEPAIYTSIEYSVQSSSVTCNGALTYAASIPTSLDAAFTVSGPYKVCIEYNDGSIKYTESEVFKYSSGPPSFTSIALTNDVIDSILTRDEYLDSFNSLTGVLIADHYQSISYRIANSADNCSLLTDYHSEPVRSNQIHHTLSLINGNSYKVCVKLENESGTTYGATSTFTYNGNNSIAELSPPPGVVLKTAIFTSDVIGAGITHYRFKLAPANASGCLSPIGYGSETAIATSLSVDFSSQPINAGFILCLVGKNISNEWQPYSEATSYSFVIGTFNAKQFQLPAPIAFSENNRAVSVSQSNSNIIALQTYDGKVLKSTDAGTSWTYLCNTKSTNYANGADVTLHIGPGPDYTVYTSAIGSNFGSFRADPLGNKDCPMISRGMIDLDNAGNVISVNNKLAGNANGVHKSTDKGASWTTLLSIPSDFSDAAISVNRNNNNQILFITYSFSTGTKARYTSDNGVTWSDIATSFRYDRHFTTSPLLASTFFQIHNGLYTVNGATNIIADYTKNDPANNLFFNPTGIAYRLFRPNATDIKLQTNNDIINSNTWSDVYTFANAIPVDAPGTTSSAMYDGVEANGTTIAVIAGRKLFISTDSGATFTQNTLPSQREYWSAISRSGTDFYLMNSSHAIIKTTDNGLNWTQEKQLSVTAPNTPAAFTMVDGTNNQLFVHTGLSAITSNDFFVANKLNFSGTSFCTFSNMDDTSQFILASGGNYWSSNDSMTSFTTSSEALIAYCSGSGRMNYFINPLNTNEILFFSSGVYKYNMATNSNLLLTIGTPTTLSAFEFFDEGGTKKIRAIDIKGNLRISTDMGSTFSTEGTAVNPYGTANANNGTIVSEATDRGFMVHYTQNFLNFTSDRGNTWAANLTLNNTFQTITSCQNINSVQLFNDGNQKAFILCSNGTLLEADF